MEPTNTNPPGEGRENEITPLLPKLDAVGLRRIAERAASLRKPGGETFYGVVEYDVARKPFLNIVSGTDGSVPENALFEVETSEVEDRPYPTDVLVRCAGGKGVNLADQYDAVFWSEAAVEKFMFPYYASKSLWGAAQALIQLSDKWYGTLPPDEGAQPETGESLSPSSVPFAIAHTPDSDYKILTEADEFHLLFKDGHGVRIERLLDGSDPTAGRAPDRATADRAPRRPAGPGGA
jgi:hypothetical protein